VSHPALLACPEGVRAEPSGPNEPAGRGGLDAFVSYSRRDQPFVIGLKEALERQGRNVWIDADDIPPGASWRRELGTGIEAADAFVFVISPDSVASPVCAEELDRALALGKRLVPVRYRPAADVPGALSSIQYIDAQQDGDHERMVEQVDEAITTDHDWVRAHTEWLARALRWEEGRRDRSRLLRGSELDTAERWLTRAAEGKQPPPTPLQAEYIAAGRQAERRRLRAIVGATLVALVVSVALGVLALVSRNEAIDQRDQARSREVAARAIAQLDVDPERSLLLALAANEIAPSGPADDALRRALTLSHVRAVMPGNGGGVSDLAVSRDGSLLVVAAHDGTARVFDPRDGRPIRALRGHRRSISTVDLSPDGKRVVTASDDGTASIWDLGDGRPLATLRHEGGPVHSAAYSRNGERVVTAGGDGTVRVWGADSGRQLAIARDHGGEALLASFHPDGGTVLSAGEDGTARLWDTRSGRSKVLARYTDPVFRASFSEDGSRALTVDARGSARIWDVASGRMVNELAGVAFNVALSPDGSRVVTTTINATVTLWDADTGAATPLVGHGTAVHAAGFSPDGTLIVTGGLDETARVWDAEQGTALVVLKGHHEGVGRVTFTPDGQSVITGSGDGTARRWDLGGQIVLRGHGAEGEKVSARVNSAEVSSDGRTALTAATDATARLWNPRTGKEIKRPRDCGLLESASFSCLATAVGLSHVSFIQGAAFSPDGRHVASAGGGDTAFVHEARSGARIASLEGHEGGLLDIRYSPGGDRLLTAGEDGTARVWRADTGREQAVLRGHRGPVNAATFMRGGRRVATAGDDGTVRLWSVRGGGPQRTLRLTRGGSGGVLDVAASPDGRWLAVPLGQTARVLDAETGGTLTVIRDHDGLVYSASFSPDGRTLVTGGQDLTARVFELPGGRPLGVLRGHSEALTSVAFTPDGRAVVTAGGDGTARIFRCDMCGSTDELLRRARRRATRELSADERRRFLTFGD
jgi:WD40 repeat protein